MNRLTAFVAGAATAALAIWVVITWIDHERNFNNQEEFR